MQEDTLVNKPYQIDVTYHFEFPDTSAVSFPVQVDLSNTQHTDIENPPEWIKIKNHQCENCPLKSKPHIQTCPAAASMIDIVEYFSEHGNHETAICRVESHNKVTVVNQPLVNSLTALIALRLASCMCPVLSKLKPMARFHEPFGDSYSTVYRVASMHLLRQYFLAEKNPGMHYTMKDLIELFENISLINRHLADRLKMRNQTCKPCSFGILSALSLNVTLLLDEHLKILERLLTEFSLLNAVDHPENNG